MGSQASARIKKRMLQKQWPCYVASRPVAPNFDLGVTDKYSGETVAWVTSQPSALSALTSSRWVATSRCWTTVWMRR